MKKFVISFLLGFLFLVSNIGFVNAYHRPLTQRAALSLGGNISDILVDAMGGKVYVANYGLHKVHVLSEIGSATRLLPLNITGPKEVDARGRGRGLRNPIALTFAPTSNLLFVANSHVASPLSTVSNLDTMSPQISSEFVSEPAPYETYETTGIAGYAHAGNFRILLSDYYNNKLQILNDVIRFETETTGDLIKGPAGIAIDEDIDTIQKVYLANSLGMSILVFPVNTRDISLTNTTGGRPIVKEIPLNFNPTSVVVHPTTKKIYAAGSFSDTVSVIKRESVDDNFIHWYENELEPQLYTNLLALYPTKDRLYAVNPNKNTLTVYNTSTDSIVKTIDIHGPTCVAINERFDKVYVGSKFGTFYVFDRATHLE